MEFYGAGLALEELESFSEKTKLESFYLYHSLLGEIYFRLNDLHAARHHYTSALSLTASHAERKMLGNKISQLVANF